MTVYLAVKTVVIATVLLILVCYHVCNYIHQSPCLTIIHWTQITALLGKTGNKAMSREQTIMLGYLTKRIVTLYKRERITVKGELLFQPAICYLSFRWVNIWHGLTVNCADRLVKNPKHFTAITISSKPNVYPSASWACDTAVCVDLAKLEREAKTTKSITAVCKMWTKKLCTWM